MELFENIFESLRDRQAEVGRILQDAQAVVGQEEENDGSAKYAGLLQDLHIEDMGKADQQEDQHLAADALEAHGGAELFIADGAHHAGDVVDGDKNHQRIEQAVAAAEEIAEPCAQAEKRGLNESPEFFQWVSFFHFVLAVFKEIAYNLINDLLKEG